MITIKLDTPVTVEGSQVSELRIETPIRAVHILKAMRATTNGSEMSEIFIESACGMPRGFLGLLTLEDFARVHAEVAPFLASFQRLSSGDVKA